MDSYDVILLGYPIWWGEAPRIISTFLESYDFTGKTIVPFCTSGSSGIGGSAEHLTVLAADATWLEGARFNPGATQDEVATSGLIAKYPTTPSYILKELANHWISFLLRKL